MDDDDLKQVLKFKYLASIFTEDGKTLCAFWNRNRRMNIKQVRQFNYLGCEMSLDVEPDFDQKNEQIPRNMQHC